MKNFVIIITATLVFCTGFLLDIADYSASVLVPLKITEADAYVYGQGRRVARRTSRRTSRRVSRRHNYYAPAAVAAPVVVGGAAVAASAVAIGTQVATLPPACSSVVVNGMTYYNCGGTYYQPVYNGPNVVYVVVQNPGY